MSALNTLVSKGEQRSIMNTQRRVMHGLLHVADFVASDHAAQAGVARIHVVDVGDGTRKSKRLQTLRLNRSRVNIKYA